MTKDNIRKEYLDSLRGLAAISVVLSHFIFAYRIDLESKYINYSPFHFFYDGFSAVTFFFILSGYVLTLSLKNQSEISIGIFYIKRFFRIMPMYLLTLIISYLCYNYYSVIITEPLSSSWINSFWDKPLSIVNMLKQLYFVRPMNDVELVPQNWSLKIEMMFSFLMPFLYIIYNKTNVKIFILFNLLLYLVFSVPVFIFQFSLGILLALNQEFILNKFIIIKKKYKILLVLFITTLYTYRYTIPMYYYYFVRKHSTILNNEDLIWILTGLGAFFSLVYCMSSNRLRFILEFKFLLLIGKISYAIYLTHFLILIFLVPRLIQFFNSFGLSNNYLIWFYSLLFLLSTTIFVSIILNLIVENPIVNIVNRIIKRNLILKNNKNL